MSKGTPPNVRAQTPEQTGTAGASTVPEQDLPWRRRGSASEEPIPHLVITWSLDEPERIGESIPISGPCVIGRGSGRDSDPHPRALVFQQRPGSTVPMHPLESSRLSRVQLTITPQPDGRIEVKNLGKNSLAREGIVVDGCTAEAGMTLAIKNAISFLVVMRPPVLEPLRSLASGGTRFPFGEPDAHGVVGESAAAWKLRDDLAFAATAPGHVLLRGPSGVGKELAARSVHGLSARADQKIVARNAATFPEGIVDVELFGNARNYPNPGTPERAGLVGEADRSTLFLDEIGELPVHLQSHLLRVLDTGGEYQRLGEAGVRKADLRFVAATNRDVAELKHDFAARFALRVEIPGLELRREDIPLLARHLLRRAMKAQPALAQRFADPTKGFVRVDPELIDALVRHAYTHHLRELDRLLWVALGSSREDFVSLTPQLEAELNLEPVSAAAATLRDEPPPMTEMPPTTSEMPTKEATVAALAAAGGSVTKAARALGMKNRFALYRVMKAYGIAPANTSEDDPASSKE